MKSIGSEFKTLEAEGWIYTPQYSIQVFQIRLNCGSSLLAAPNAYSLFASQLLNMRLRDGKILQDGRGGTIYRSKEREHEEAHVSIVKRTHYHVSTSAFSPSFSSVSPSDFST